MKSDEEQTFRKKVVALAADEVWKRAKELEPGLTAPPSTRQPPPRSPKRTTVTRAPQPTFDGVHLRVFDVSASNEPVLVLTATAHLPVTERTAVRPHAPDYYVTGVAHYDPEASLSNVV